MQLSIKNALYIAASILLVSALLTQFEKRDLIVATLLTLSAPVIFTMAYRKEHKKFVQCAIAHPRSKKVWLVIFAAVVVLFGFGYSVVKLIYLWSQ